MLSNLFARSECSMRVVLAFVFAPLFPGLVLYLFATVTGASGGQWIFTFTVLIAHPVAILFGVPAFLLLQRAHLTSYMAYFISGAILSVIPIFYLVVTPQDIGSYPSGILLNESQLVQVLIILTAGMSVSSVFWVVARPDKNQWQPKGKILSSKD